MHLNARSGLHPVASQASGPTEVYPSGDLILLISSLMGQGNGDVSRGPSPFSMPATSSYAAAAQTHVRYSYVDSKTFLKALQGNTSYSKLCSK